MNEKLLGEFIKKHNVRDKLFSEFFFFSSMVLLADHVDSRIEMADSTVSEAMDRSPTLPRI